MLGLSDRAEILQACCVGVLVVSAKFLGQGVVGFWFGGLLSGKKSSILRYQSHFFCSKRTWKDSGVGQGRQVTSISISLLNLVHFEVF